MNEPDRIAQLEDELARLKADMARLFAAVGFMDEFGNVDDVIVRIEEMKSVAKDALS
jgi:hypothetical protein